MNELTSNGVQIYQFPTDDETVADLNGTMNRWETKEQVRSDNDVS